MPNQLSRCCKAEIELTGEDRPNHLKCKGCNRIIGTPYEIKYVSAYDLNNPREIPGGYVCDKINELIDAVNKLQELARCAESSLKEHSNDISKLNQYETENFVARKKTDVLLSKIDDMLNSLSPYSSPEDKREKRYAKNAQPTRTPLDDLVDEIDELYPMEETRQVTIRKKTLRKILERYFSL